jgi:hypothetical protein
MVAAWASDLIWLPMIGVGNASSGLWGFGLSCVVALIAKAAYDRHKAQSLKTEMGRQRQ